MQGERELKSQHGTRQESRNVEKQGRKTERSDWDCVSGIKLPICICIRLTERKRENMTKSASRCWHETMARGRRDVGGGKV